MSETAPFLLDANVLIALVLRTIHGRKGTEFWADDVSWCPERRDAEPGL